jgi:hypothetical protein
VAARDAEREKFAVEPMGMKGERRLATSRATDLAVAMVGRRGYEREKEKVGGEETIDRVGVGR